MELFLLPPGKRECDPIGRALPVTEALVNEEMNGTLELTVRLPLSLAAQRDLTPQPGQVICAACPDPRGKKDAPARLQPFRVKSVKRQSGRPVTLETEHLYFDALRQQAPAPFEWENEPLSQVCAALSLLSGCIRYRAEIDTRVSGCFEDSAAAIAEALCEKYHLQLVRDGTEALLRPREDRKRGFTLSETQVTEYRLEDTLDELGQMHTSAEAVLPLGRGPCCHVFDTVTFLNRVLMVNRTLYDPVRECTRALWLGEPQPRLNGNAFTG